MAAPIASQVLGDLLPALEIAKDNVAEEDIKNEVTVPEVRNLTLKEAKSILKEAGLDINVNTENVDDTQTITDQLPKPRIICI